MPKLNRKKILVLALYAAEIMLKNGAETYRVEDTIMRICKSRKIKYVEALVTPTGIHISVDNKNTEEENMLSFNKRIKNRKINLEKVAKVNDFSRKFVNTEMTIKEGMDILREIDDKPAPYKNYIQAVLAELPVVFLYFCLELIF